jgi:hypothetical protein
LGHLADLLPGPQALGFDLLGLNPTFFVLGLPVSLPGGVVFLTSIFGGLTTPVCVIPFLGIVDVSRYQVSGSLAGFLAGGDDFAGALVLALPLTGWDRFFAGGVPVSLRENSKLSFLPMSGRVLVVRMAPFSGVFFLAIAT